MGQLTFQLLRGKLESRSSLNSYPEELSALTDAIASLIDNPAVRSIAAFIEDFAEKKKLLHPAHFDNLDSRLPDNIRRNLQLSLKERICFVLPL